MSNINISSTIGRDIRTKAILRRASMDVETLESRTLMSTVRHVSHAHTHSQTLAVSSKLKSSPSTLASPTALAAAATPQSVSLSWTDNALSATGYTILRSTAGGSFTQIGNVTSGSTASYVDSTIVTGQGYQYEVIATASALKSVHSAPAYVVTPLAAPTDLAATATAGGGVSLSWTDNDANATGYQILRSRNGSSYYTDYTLANPNAAAFTDVNADSGSTYYYEVVAIKGSGSSAPSVSTSATIAVAAPSGLTAVTGNGGTTLAWTGNDRYATGYQILRSTDGNTYKRIATQNAASATTFTDTGAKTGVLYYYEIAALHNSTASAVTSPSHNVLPLAAPGNVTLSVNQNASLNINWTDNDASATSYDIQRSTDGGTSWTDLAQVTGTSSNSYTDTTASTGTTYSYEIKAVNSLTASVFSTVAAITDQSASAAVTITTRFGDELVITARGASDTVSLAESNGLITIIADGQTYTAPVPDAGIFLYARGGADSFTLSSTDITRTTIVSIDNATTHITSSATNVSAWVDSTDIVTGTAVIHSVAAFAGGVSKSAGASLADPKDIGSVKANTLSLFGTGPNADDIHQGAAGDCYFLSSLAAFAHLNPTVLTESAVDMGDGTYTVQFMKGSTPVFVRVNPDVSASNNFDHVGTSTSAWGVIMEKAFAYYRTGANTYASTSSGWMGEVYADLGVNSTNFAIGSTDSALLATLSASLTNGKVVTFGTPASPPNLVGGHAYTLMSVSTDGNGVHHYTVRNPWGVQGRAIEDSGGYATLTFAQMQANFTAGCEAA